MDNDYKFFLIDLNRMKFKKMNSEDRLKNFRRLNLDDDLIKTVSIYYSEITRIDKNIIFEKIKKYSKDFQDKRAKRKKIKQFFKL